MQKVKLNNGIEMPLVGLWCISDDRCRRMRKTGHWTLLTAVID